MKWKQFHPGFELRLLRLQWLQKVFKVIKYFIGLILVLLQKFLIKKAVPLLNGFLNIKFLIFGHQAIFCQTMEESLTSLKIWLRN